MGLKLFGKAENIQATPCTYRMRNPDGPGVLEIEVGVRPVPPLKRTEISVRHFGKKRPMRSRLVKDPDTGKREALEHLEDQEPERLLAFGIEKASFALVYTKGFPAIEASDDEAAKMLTEATGVAVAKGASVKPDEGWTQGLKELAFTAYDDFLRFVNTQADELGDLDAADEAALGKT